jgi:hypothetical protein
MPSSAATVRDYLASLPEDRRTLLERVRTEFRRHLPRGFEEGMQYGMVGWFVPHSRYPAGYHCDPKQPLPFAGLASQKQHCSLYLIGLYLDPELRDRFEKAWTATGRKLDMGKACVRFRRFEDIAFDALGEALAALSVDRYIERYEASRPAARKATTTAVPRETKVTKKTVTKTASKTPKPTSKAKASPAPKKTAPKKTATKAARSSARRDRA